MFCSKQIIQRAAVSSLALGHGAWLLGCRPSPLHPSRSSRGHRRGAGRRVGDPLAARGSAQPTPTPRRSRQLLSKGSCGSRSFRSGTAMPRCDPPPAQRERCRGTRRDLGQTGAERIRNKRAEDIGAGLSMGGSQRVPAPHGRFVSGAAVEQGNRFVLPPLSAEHQDGQRAMRRSERRTRRSRIGPSLGSRHPWPCPAAKRSPSSVPGATAATPHAPRCHAGSSEWLRCTSGRSCSSCDASAHKESLTNELLITINKL